MRILLILLLFIIPSQAFSQDWRTRAPLPLSDCAVHIPFGMPLIVHAETTMICRRGYLIQHDNRARIPIWAAYQLTAEKAVGCVSRTNNFRQDPALPPGASATASDYARSGFDIGHMVPNADMRWNAQVEEESNFFSNAAPQEPSLNRGPWRILEDAIRAWVIERGEVIIYVGPIYESHLGERIAFRVVIPNAFFKVIIDPKTKEVMAFVYPNRAITGTSITDFAIPIPEVQMMANINLPLPPDAIFLSAPWPQLVSPRVERAKHCARQ